MEESTFEALKIGISVFVFLMALTSGILLMTNILDMANYANEQSISSNNGTLVEAFGETTERVYTGSQIIKYYNQKSSEYIFYVKLGDLSDKELLQTFIKNKTLNTYLNKEFLLEYKGVRDNSYEYVFKLKNS